MGLIHVAGQKVSTRTSEYANLDYRQDCARCGRLLSTSILGYPVGALVIEDRQYVAVYLGHDEANCAATNRSAA